MRAEKNVMLSTERAKVISANVNALKADVAHIQNDATCPTCKQAWIGQSANDKLVQLNADIQKNIQDLYNLKPIIESKSNIAANIQNIDQDIDNLNSSIALKQQSVYKISEEVSKIISEDKQKESQATIANMEREKAINDKYEVQISEIKEEIHKADNVSLAHRHEIAALEAQVLSSLNQITQHNEIKSKYEAQLRDLKEARTLIEDQITALDKEALLAKEAIRFIKVFVIQIFQESLDLIGDVASNILRSIPNMQTATIAFDSSKETKSGVIRDEVTPIISMNGDEAVSIKSLSGGEQTSINLAVDLAVIDIIEAKTGKGANFYVIDEPFDGLDGVCKENYLEILKSLDINKKIILVDHSSELKEMVYDKITVVKEGEYSRIEYA